MYFRTATPAQKARDLHRNVCGICGADTTPAFAQHDFAVHEVYYFDNHGIESVTRPNRPFVEGWSNGTIPLGVVPGVDPLPTPEEVRDSEDTSVAH